MKYTGELFVIDNKITTTYFADKSYTITLISFFLAPIIENYDYYDENYDVIEEEAARVPRSAIEWFDARTRNRRDLDNNLNSEEAVTYTVCVRLVE